MRNALLFLYLLFILSSPTISYSTYNPPDTHIVCRALIVQDNKLLLVSNNGSLWSSPGGHLQLGETLPQCLKRELYEELGIMITPSQIQFVFEFTESPIYKLEIYFDIDNTNLSTPNDKWTDLGGKIRHFKYFGLEDFAKHNVQPQFLYTYLRNLVDNNANNLQQIYQGSVVLIPFNET